MSNFKNGDVVRLKSGSPTMTVTGTHDSAGSTAAKMIHCMWFDHPTERRAGSVQNMNIHADALELYKQEA